MTQIGKHRKIARFAIAATLALAFTLAAYAQAPPSTKSFLWKVQSPAGPTPLYLAGSVHMLSADIYPLSPAFDRAFEGAGTLIEEVDLGAAITAAPTLLAKGLFVDGRTLADVVSKSTFDLVAPRLQGIGLPIEMVGQMKPWLVAMLLTVSAAQKAGLSPAYGLDQHFFEKARRMGKPVIGLETADGQVAMFDALPLAVQEQMLRSTIGELDQASTHLKVLIGAWRRGDAATIEQFLLSDSNKYPGAYQSLLVDRNRNWMAQIEACSTQRSPCFVVVGAAHLVGPEGLLKLLERKGYRIEQQ